MTMTLEPRDPEAVSLDLPFSPESARVARGALHAWFDSVEVCDETREDARLLISELVGNSVRHARPLDDEVLRVEWRVEADGAPRSTLAIKVTDGAPRRRPPSSRPTRATSAAGAWPSSSTSPTVGGSRATTAASRSWPRSPWPEPPPLALGCRHGEEVTPAPPQRVPRARRGR